MFPERRIAMKIKNFLLVLIFALTPAMWAQDQPAQAPPGPGSGNQMRAEHRQKMTEMHKQMTEMHKQMMEMHKQEIEAMRADIEKMKASLAQMKANVLTIRDPNELSRWRDNVDMWETVVTHMDRMQKSMESMGPGMMHGHHMGGPPPTSPSEKKPE
jgi:TolA-binding protein